MKLPKPISEYPVMASCCKTCPFKKDEKGLPQDIRLMNLVIQRTLFKAQQICHSTMKGSKIHRCRGSFDYNKEIYGRMGYENIITDVSTEEQTRKPVHIPTGKVEEACRNSRT